MKRTMEIQKIIFWLVFFTIGAQARTRFLRQVANEEAAAPPSETIQPPPRSGQRERFVIAGSSRDFKLGSVIPASASMGDVIPRSAQFLRGVDLEDDYGTFDSRYHLATVAEVPLQMLNITMLEEKKPIYVIPLREGNQSSQSENRNVENTTTTTSNNNDPKEIGSEDSDFTDNQSEEKTTAESRNS